MKLAMHLHLVSRLRIRTAVPPILHECVCVCAVAPTEAKVKLIFTILKMTLT
jgi:hypothetical protein